MKESIILHIVTLDAWKTRHLAGFYKSDSLDTEGFIHCSTSKQVVEVANYLFRGRNDLLLLILDEKRILSRIVYEGLENGEQYPHIYGPLNIDAVNEIVDFIPDGDGFFNLPKEIKKYL